MTIADRSALASPSVFDTVLPSAVAAQTVDITGARRPDGPEALFDYDIAVVGLGYVGLPTALAYHAAGCRVLGVDASPARLRTIVSEGADLLDSDRRRLRSARRDPGFLLTGDPSLLSSAAAVVVCVPTPVDDHLVPDLEMLRGACRTVIAHATRGQLLMLTSTSYVGCTEDLLVAPLAEAGFDVGHDIHVAFSAERIDPGNSDVTHEQVPRVVGAPSAASLARAEELLLRYAGAVHPVSSLAAAEMTKLVENTFRAVNIALANEFSDICRAFGIDVTDVLDAAATKPYGFMRFMPGPGVGGHCIPCDPHYLLWQLRTRRIAAPLIAQAMNSIALRPAQVVDRVREIVSDAGRGLPGARVIVAGVSYKMNVADLRESPALEIIERLMRAGATVRYVDPLIPAVRLRDRSTMTALPDPGEFDADVVIVHTGHDDLDLSWIRPETIVLDTTYRAVSLPARVTL